MVLIFQFLPFESAFQSIFISLVLKAKQQKAIQLPLVFLKFVKNQF